MAWLGGDSGPGLDRGFIVRPLGRDAYWTGSFTNPSGLDTGFDGEATEGNMKTKLILLGAAIIGLMLGQTSVLAGDANGNHDTYIWVVGATTPSDTAIAPDGSTITMKGQGTLTAGPENAASGGGTYSLSSGGSGTWTATGVLGFVSYGPAAPPLPSFLFGGETKLNISLSNGATGVLTIFCVLGSPPPSKEEGITVILGTGGQFTKQDGGNTVFVHT